MKTTTIVIVALAWFVCDALNGNEFLSEESDLRTAKSWHTIRGSHYCAFVAQKYSYLVGASAQNYAHSVTQAKKQAETYWKQYNCQTQYGSLSQYTMLALVDKEEPFELDTQVRQITEPAPHDFSETYELLEGNDYAPEDVFLEAQSTVQTMLQKGVKESDCKDLAKTMCKEVEGEVRKSQSVQDKLDNGSKCASLGKKAVLRATAEEGRRKKEFDKAKKGADDAAKTKVDFGSHRYSSLKVGECGVFFSSRAYLHAQRKHQDAVTQKALALGKLKEAAQATVAMIMSSFRQVEKCTCDTKMARSKLWKVASSASTLARRQKAHAKCTMMRCVLDHTSLSSSKCKSHLPALRKKALDPAVESAVCKLTVRVTTTREYRL